METVALEYAAALGSVTCLVAAGLSLGLPFRKALPESLLPAEKAVLQIVGGLGLLGLLLFGAGSLHFSSSWIAATVGAPAVLGLWVTLRTLRLPRRWPAWLGNTAVLWTAAVFCFVLVSSIDQPIGTSDEIGYHLYFPKMWLQRGIVSPQWDCYTTLFPQTVEMLFGALMSLSNHRAPGLLTAVWAALLLIQVWGLARRMGAQHEVAGLCVLLVATMPNAMDRVGVAFIDVIVASFALAGIRIVFDQSNRWQLLAGSIYFGYCAGSKYTGLQMVTAAAGVLLVAFKPARPWRARLGDAALLAIISSTVAGPWYFRNYLITGFPLFPAPPFVARYFPVPAFPQEQVVALYQLARDWGGGKRYGHGWLDFLLLPLRLTYSPAMGFEGGLGIAPLALAPIGFLALWGRRMAREVALWTFLVILLWFLTLQEIRYLVHVYCILAIFAAFGAEPLLRQPSAAGRWIVWSALAVSVLHGTATVGTQHFHRFHRVISPGYARASRSQFIPDTEALDFLNYRPEVSKILLLNRGLLPYYLERPFVVLRGEYGEQPIPGISRPAEALQHLRELRVTHVVDCRDQEKGLSFGVTPKDLELSLVFEKGNCRIYQVHGR